MSYQTSLAHISPHSVLIRDLQGGQRTMSNVQLCLNYPECVSRPWGWVGWEQCPSGYLGATMEPATQSGPSAGTPAETHTQAGWAVSRGPNHN